MKRISGLYEQICSLENLNLADETARKGKKHTRGVIVHDRNREENILKLQQMLQEKTYKTSEYTTFTIYEPKERLIFRLPYYPDRIAHHAVMRVLEKNFVATFTRDTYSCIKGRGIKAAADGIKKSLKDVPGTQYCLQMDIRKFYPSIDHAILKALLRKKFKDKDLLWLLDGIIESSDGLPIGNYLSQYLANFYLSYFDHWLKEVKGVKYYFRYADDMVILGPDKPALHQLRKDIQQYLQDNLKLAIKENHRVFPVAKTGIDFIGYRFFHTHILLRKRIKQNFARKLAKGARPKTIASYGGWLKRCNSRNLSKKLLHE